MRLSREQALELARNKGIDPAALGLEPEATSQPSSLAKSRSQGQAGRAPKRNPQTELTILSRQRWPGEVFADYVGAVPGRKFEVDIALPAYRLAIEVDGWSFHGKHKSDFHRDREKRNLLVMHGWLVLAFSARDVMADPGSLLDMADGLIGRRRRAWALCGNS